MERSTPWDSMVSALMEPRPQIDEPAPHVTLDERSDLMALFTNLVGE